MATLKEAVESGRRWRHPKWPKDYWRKPGHLGHPETIRLDEALSSDFEIEPEPKKPREWLIAGSCIQSTVGKGLQIGETVRVHDADACDRLHNINHFCEISVTWEQFMKWGHKFNEWLHDQSTPTIQFPLTNPYALFEVRRDENS